jgi:hypothetical protein
LVSVYKSGKRPLIAVQSTDHQALIRDFF